MEHHSTGTVVKVEGRRVWVATSRQSGCGSCAAKGACGTSVLDTLFSGRNAPIELEASFPLKEGDQVIMTLSEQALLRQSFWAYGVPLLGFFVGALLLRSVSELAALAGALAGLVGGWWLVRRVAPIEKPRIRKIIPMEGVAYEVD